MDGYSEIAKALGSRGGQSTRDKYGKEHFKMISAMAAKKRQEKAAAKKSPY